MIYRPIVLNKELKFSRKKFIVSKTDREGNILFINENFCDITGYTQDELIGQPHNVLRHPDMPQAIFYLIWKALLAGMEVSAVIKNVAKSGEYYWVVADFSMERDNYGKIETLSSFKRIAPADISQKVEILYAEMVAMERKGGMKTSLLFLEKFLEEKEMTYNEYLEDLIVTKGLYHSFVTGIKSILS